VAAAVVTPRPWRAIDGPPLRASRVMVNGHRPDIILITI
jgi:hypothetical protein